MKSHPDRSAATNPDDMRLHEKRRIARPVDEVFEYVSDFANIQHWDPGVRTACQIDPGPVGVGTRFEVLATFGGRDVPLTYEMTEFEPNRKVTLVGTSEAVDAVDEILFERSEGGTLVDYTADLTFNNWVRFLGPAVGPLMRRVGEKALDGLVETFDR